MQEIPQKWKRYDEYEAEKYNCISVNDVFLEDIAVNFNHIDFYWHTLDDKRKGLAYCGITLIPPNSIKFFLDIIKDIPELSELKNLSEKALEENKWMIHFGI